MSAYWLGVLTPFALAAAGFALLVLWALACRFLHGLGFRLELKMRDLENVSDFTLRRDIWWERSFGLVFAGGWYYEGGCRRGVNRWVGLGRPNGPVAMVIRVRDLGEMS